MENSRLSEKYMKLSSLSKYSRHSKALAIAAILLVFIIILKNTSNIVQYNKNRKLVLLVISNNIEEARNLLSHGANPNSTNKLLDYSYWHTLRSNNEPNNILYDRAIVLAARNGNLRMVHLLLEYGAKVNQGGGCGDSELDYAEKQGLKEMIDLLIRAGCKKNRTKVCL